MDNGMPTSVVPHRDSVIKRSERAYLAEEPQDLRMSARVHIYKDGALRSRGAYTACLGNDVRGVEVRANLVPCSCGMSVTISLHLLMCHSKARVHVCEIDSIAPGNWSKLPTRR